MNQRNRLRLRLHLPPKPRMDLVEKVRGRVADEWYNTVNVIRFAVDAALADVENETLSEDKDDGSIN